MFDKSALNCLRWTMHVHMYRLWSVVGLSYHSMQGGHNAFLLCAMGSHLSVAEYLAPKMEGHLFDSDDDGHTALHIAAYFGQLSIVEYLVGSCGFDVKAIDKVCLHCWLLVWCVFCTLSGHTCCMGTVNNEWRWEESFQYHNLCYEYFIVYFFASCMYRYILHACVPVVFVCMESSSTVEPL